MEDPDDVTKVELPKEPAEAVSADRLATVRRLLDLQVPPTAAQNATQERPEHYAFCLPCIQLSTKWKVGQDVESMVSSPGRPTMLPVCGKEPSRSIDRWTSMLLRRRKGGPSTRT